MRDRITAVLPARNLEDTLQFYARLGFTATFKDANWMILGRGPLELEFFPYPDLDPATSSFQACVRVADVDALHAEWAKAGLPLHGVPRLTPAEDKPWGLREAALIDPNGTLLHLLSPLRRK